MLPFSSWDIDALVPVLFLMNELPRPSGRVTDEQWLRRGSLEPDQSAHPERNICPARPALRSDGTQLSRKPESSSIAPYLLPDEVFRRIEFLSQHSILCFGTSCCQAWTITSFDSK